MDPLSPALWVADRVRAIRQSQRRVRVTVHEARFISASANYDISFTDHYYFIKVTNLSPNRHVEVTHVWFDTTPRVDVINVDRPLPRRLRLDELFETWIPVAALPGEYDIRAAARLCRVLLSNHKTIKGRWWKNVPPVGQIAD